MEHYFSRLQSAIRNYWDKPALTNFEGESFTYSQMAAIIEKFRILL